MRREDLLDHYERELLYVRRAGEAFARSYPKIARRLALGPDQAADPNVERLIESFAFLSGRLQLNLEREFPRFSEALLGILHPQMIAPIPAMGIARMEPTPGEGRLTGGFRVPRGTPLHAVAEDNIRCRFRTAYDVTLWPVAVTDAAVEPADRYDFLDGAATASVLRLRLETRNQSFENLPIDKLRLFIDGETILTSALHELFLCGVVEIAYVQPGKPPVRLRGETLIAPVGFGPDETVLPHPKHAQPAYGLLQEYFEFPQKFDFYDLPIPQGRLSGEVVDILIAMSRPLPNRLTLRKDSFVLGCTPIVNLFNRTAEPIRLNHRRTAYRVVPDALRERTTEVHSILEVSGLRDGDGMHHRYVPLFSHQHAEAETEPRGFWLAAREPTQREDVPGTDIHLSLHHLDLTPTDPADETLLVRTLCTNRALAEQVPAGAALMIEESAPIATIRCLHKPTPGRPAPAGGSSAWKLISHLSVNHLSLTGDAEGLRALQSILLLHAPDDPSAQHQIRGVQGLSSRPVLHRMGQDAWRGFVRGLEVTVALDERNFVGASPLVFGGVLSRFLGLYINVNAFAQLRLRSVQREGVWKAWSRLAGSQPVL
ncbi:type VI secretion system protein ImpG [Azospirillum sp. OGB3]|uniref:type VI secretion system baseplate subunit TssF n=1 Tax=Azospirillum sp. OGB3 TaxID=2587012 RepID=UPI001606B121|nr:type VI secretion system baseplate subunit TssF [Azospirillum sp. OGB3]MBB3268458.1 type VI secretion system protein ImpG [Azospirillum sp. OGB3]